MDNNNNNHQYIAQMMFEKTWLQAICFVIILLMSKITL